MLTQIEKLKNLLLDGKPHSTVEILKEVYGSEHLGIARIGARIHDLKNQGCDILGFFGKKNRKIYYYQLINYKTLVFKK